MGVYRRGKVYWIDYYGPNRKRVQESSQSSNQRDAEKLLTLRRSEILRGVYKQPVKISLGEFGERYMEHAKANKRSWLRDEQMLNHLYEYFGKGTPLTEIAPMRIEAYKIQRQGKIADSTINRELALLKRMFNLAITWDLYSGLNPVRKVKFFREFNNRLRVLSLEEERKLLNNAIPYLQDLIRFAVNTGLRTGEVFSLRWSHVDLTRGILSVFASKTQTIREIPINSEARVVLEAWKLNKKNESVFYNPLTGKPFVDLKTGFALACEKAGISDVTWHTLHHTFASRLVNSGVDIVTVKELLGHSSIIVTMRYAHTNIESKRAAVEKLDSFGDNLVIVPAKRQQSNAVLSLNRVASYNNSRV
ncbi:MAG: tyrosine-type recombinase/integrase [Candidatus Acidiferrales bacterium]